MSFSFECLRFHISAEAMLCFPGPLPANVLRGALGTVLMRRPASYARIFAPVSGHGPSGLAQRPRPFVFRAAHLADATIQAGQEFSFDLHVFDSEFIDELIDALSEVMSEGLAAERSHVRLREVDRTRVTIALEPTKTVHRLAIDFATPTELKRGGQLIGEPDFAVLMLLAHARLSNLSNFYGRTRLETRPPGWGDAAQTVQIAQMKLQRVEATRFSTRTAQRHPIGGFTGTVVYEGDLTAFLPYLQAAQHTGVGRQTTWGKGELHVRL